MTWYFELGSLVLGTAWTVFQSTKWYQSKKGTKLGEILDILEGATTKTYIEFVRPAKSAQEGKLTEPQKIQAMNTTLATAESVCKARGLKWELLGSLKARPFVEAFVQKLKKDA